MKRSLLLAVAAAAALALAAPAGAGERIDAAVAALQANPVYVDPSAELAIGAADQARLRRKIDTSGAGPVYIAILPLAVENETGGDPDGVLQALHDGLARPGTYAVVVGRHFRAGSEGILPSGEAGRLATEALKANRGDGVTATLTDFVDRVAEAQRSGDGRSGDRGPGTGGGILIGLLVFGGIAFLVLRSVHNRRRREAELAEVKAAAHDDLIALADDVQKLEEPVEASPQAKQEYEAALNGYEQASGAFDRAVRPKELEAVTSALEEGRFHMTVAEAVLAENNRRNAGLPVSSTRATARRPAKSTGRRRAGRPDRVPACEADAQAVERGLEPAARQVMARGQQVPVLERSALLRPVGRWLLHAFRRTGFLSGSSSASSSAARTVVGVMEAGAARATAAASGTGTAAEAAATSAAAWTSAAATSVATEAAAIF